MNFFYTMNSTSAQSQFCMIWRSNLTFKNITLVVPLGVGIFYIQYKSQLIIQNFTISNFVCSTSDNGGIFSVNSNSSLIANTISINDVTMESLMYVDSSNFTINNSQILNFRNKFIYSGLKSYIYIQNSNFANSNLYLNSHSFTAIDLENDVSFHIFNCSFVNLSTSQNGPVKNK